uniref:Yippee domain-containing protein n=1 Tax=Oryzias sinensis TaxID=183150 RepID=A0A8C7WY26_9TELE
MDVFELLTLLRPGSGGPVPHHRTTETTWGLDVCSLSLLRTRPGLVRRGSEVQFRRRVWVFRATVGAGTGHHVPQTRGIEFCAVVQRLLTWLQLHALSLSLLQSFQGSQGRAYLFNSVVNVGCGPAEERVLLTGLHAVADIYCENCKTTLGWKYVSFPAEHGSRCLLTRRSVHRRIPTHFWPLCSCFGWFG